MEPVDISAGFLAECTSPSILQDITMDKSEMDARGATGLTMKEYDDQLKKLTAENFNLKLKIYFMDERITKMEGIHDKDIIRENVELKVDNEQKTKEVERQSKLLSDSLEALEKMQRDHQQELSEASQRFDSERRELQVRAGALEARLRLLEENTHPSPEAEDNHSSCREQIQNLQQKLQDCKLRMNRLEKEDQQLREKLAALEEETNEAQHLAAEVEKLTQMNEVYEKQLHQTMLATSVERTAESCEEDPLGAKIEELEKEVASRDVDLAKLNVSYQRACDTIKSFLKKVLEARNENKQLTGELDSERKTVEELRQQVLSLQPPTLRDTADQKKSNPDSPNSSGKKNETCQCGDEKRLERIQELEGEIILLKARQEHSQGGELACELENKKREIERLKSELKKLQLQLLELVNKELWDKNRQIEKLERRLRADDIDGLKQQLKDLEMEKSNLSRELAVMQEREAPLREACCLLTERLEELAGFLDSLLTSKLVLELSGEQHEAIRQAVDRSRELSRRLTLSFEEASLLGDTTCLTDQSAVIAKLRDHLSFLSHQVRQRDIELSLCQGDQESRPNERRESEPLICTGNECDQRWLELDVAPDDELEGRRQSATGARKKLDKVLCRMLPAGKGEVEASESEAWSEPDRSVSLARMGRLDSASVTPLRLSKCADSSGSSEETLNETRNSGKRTRSVDPEARRLHAKVRSLEESNRGLRVQLTLLENKQAIFSKLNGESAPQLLLEIQQSLSEYEETREGCERLRVELAAARGDLAVVTEHLTLKERLCTEQKDAIEKLEAKTEEITLEYELRLLEAAQGRDIAEKRAADVEVKLCEAEKLRMDLEKKVSDIERKVEDSQDKSKAQVKEAERHLDSCERLLQEKAQSERKIRELQQFVACLQKNVEERKSEVEEWVARARRDRDEIMELNRRLLETERSKTLVEAKVKEEGERIKWMEGKLRELEQAMDQCEQETQTKIGEEVRRRVEGRMIVIRKEWVPRVELEKTRRMLDDVEGRLLASETAKTSLQESFKEREDALSIRISRLENEKRDWARQMNELRLHSSEVELELTRLATEKVRLEEELRKAVEKQSQLLRNHRQAEETIRNLEKQAEDELSVRGTTPASTSVHDFLSSRNLNSSPDLGIESDQGRFSSLEHQDHRALVPRDANMNQIETENMELKRRLAKLGQTLEETVAELAAANHTKRQMERAICKQLHKTHHILKKARINFEMHDSDSVDERQ